MNKPKAVALISDLAKAGISTEIRVNHHEGDENGNWIVSPTGNNINLLTLAEVADKRGLVATIDKVEKGSLTGSGKIEFRKKESGQ